MSVMIKGMEMPESCEDCILNNGLTCYAVPDYKDDGVVGRTGDRPDWCPLVPAADVRPVVLCRDCKYWFNAPAADGFNSCERDALIRHEDFFCAAGEKREEN